MLIDEVLKQFEEFSQFLNFVEQYGKMSCNICDQMHGGCNIVNNLNQIQNCIFQKLSDEKRKKGFQYVKIMLLLFHAVVKFQKPFANFGVKCQTIVLSSILC